MFGTVLVTVPLVSAPASSRFAADGMNQGNFNRVDWALLLTISLIWGSSFLWIAIGLDSFHPAVIALFRMVFGAGLLAFVPSARQSMPRSTWPALMVVAVAGNTAPALFFPLAQQRVESSVAGMLNSVGPILVLFLSVAMLRRAPERNQIIGLIIGLCGAITIAGANLAGTDAEPLGVFFVFCAVAGYSISNNFLPPLAQAYGGAAVMGRAMVISSVLLAPWGLWGLSQSRFEWKPALAIVILGVFCTGIARSLFATLNGRVGAPRSSLVGYLVPVTAIVLGVIVRNESVGAIELVGTALILCGAALISRGSR
jgi:drug/metabolite transporter (DMT)-like permease